MSQHFARSHPTPRHPSMSTLRTVSRGGIVAVVASLALLAPGSARAQTATSTTLEAAPAAVSVTSTAVAQGTTVQPTVSRYWSTMTTGKYERRLKLWMNRARARHGMRSVEVRVCEDGFAERWAGFLNRTDGFYHQDLGPIMRTCRQTHAGEILALGSVTPWRMVQMWLGSPEHRRLMLTRDFHRAGISAVRGNHNVWIGCIDLGGR